MKLHIDRLTNEMERYKMEAVVQLKKGMRTLAKNYLRQKRSIQRTLENKYIALETMETMQRKIQEAHSDIMIIDAYKAGSAALKQTLNINELTPAAVDNAMDEVQEALEAYQEVNDTVMQGNDTISDIAGISKNELEEELELLLAGENESFDDLGISAFDKMNVADTSASDREPNFSDILATSQSTPPHFPSVPTTPPQYDVYKVPAGSSQVHDVYDMRFPDVPSTAMPTSPSSQNYKERNVETIILE
uniref:Charged multivesicular body protein 7-like n=1 Tax=Saccoglossus kowalevskii TaxID=10224 RepID=A0ABM0M6C1_SACKO|nr:PREDICTED: charged multivesicular body protein 7-like [Saccoglossus kowalevskii]